jgi:hypothetical protein
VLELITFRSARLPILMTWALHYLSDYWSIGWPSDAYNMAALATVQAEHQSADIIFGLTFSKLRPIRLVHVASKSPLLAGPIEMAVVQGN